MKNIIYLLVMALGLFVHPARAEHVSLTDTELIAKGARLYSENCGRCHNPRPASDYSKTEWSVVMPHMRDRAHMTGDEALAVEAFLDSTLTADVRNLNKTEAPAGVVADPQQVLDKYGCQGCHQIGGAGGALGPALDGVVDRRGEEYVRKKLLDPKFDNPASAMPQFPLSEAEIKALIDRLKQAKKQ